VSALRRAPANPATGCGIRRFARVNSTSVKFTTASMGEDPMRSLVDNLKLYNNYLHKISTIINNDGHGQIEGVEFDIKDERLDADHWDSGAILRCVLYLPGQICDNVIGNPHSLWFDWFGEYDPDLLRDRLSRSRKPTSYERIDAGDSTTIPRRLPSPEIEKIVVASKPVHYLKRGDKINVCDVVDKIVGSDFEHEHDRIVKVVYIQITKAGGTAERLTEPCIVTGRLQMLTADVPVMDSFLTDSFLTILSRIAELHNSKNVTQLLFSVEQSKSNDAFPSSKTYELVAPIARRLYIKLAPAWLPVPDDEDGEGEAEAEEAQELLDIVNDAATLGWLCRDIEAGLKLKPLARSRLDLRKLLSDAGKDGAKPRQTQAEKWHKHATAVAIDFCHDKDPVPTAPAIESASKYPPAKPGALRVGPLKAAWPSLTRLFVVGRSKER